MCQSPVSDVRSSAQLVRFLCPFFSYLLTLRFASTAPGVESIRGLTQDLVDSTVEVYDMITSQLLPTPAKSHYTFNLRDLSKVFQGMLMMEITKVEVT